MTYRAAAALQGAVYQRLSTWGGLNGVAVVDAVPPGTGTAKAAGAEVSLALCEVPLTLAVGSLVDLTFVRAVAKRLNTGESRRIDLTFRARITF